MNGLLAGVLAVVSGAQDELTPRQRQAVVQIARLSISVMFFREFEGRLPKSLQELVERPADAKQWPEGGYLSGGKIPKDPWGNDFQFAGEEIRSLGADGKPGGEDENRDLSAEDLDLDSIGGRRGGRKGAALDANERNAAGTMKAIATAQADFRSNDRDNNRVQDFWTGDVAGLYRIDNSCVADTPSMIKLIELATALADHAPSPGLTVMGTNVYSCEVGKLGKRQPKAGYWFLAMKEDRSTDPPTKYRQNTGGAKEDVYNTSRFGVCAFPAEYGKTGKKTFVLNESNTLFWKDTGGKPMEYRPTDEELARDWKKLN